jgi:hypothetical protein
MPNFVYRLFLYTGKKLLPRFFYAYPGVRLRGITQVSDLVISLSEVTTPQSQIYLALISPCSFCKIYKWLKLVTFATESDVAARRVRDRRHHITVARGVLKYSSR